VHVNISYRFLSYRISDQVYVKTSKNYALYTTNTVAITKPTPSSVCWFSHRRRTAGWHNCTCTTYLLTDVVA